MVDKEAEFDSLDLDSRCKVYEIAGEWFSEHKRDIEILVKNADNSYPPSPNKYWTPQDWNASNWKWFIDAMCA